MTKGNEGIVIAGGGLAGQRCAETLRSQGFNGAIRMVCAELHRPYDRPPLSKDLLTSKHGEASLHFKPAQWYAEHSIELLLGVSATALCPGERRLSLSDGTRLTYDRLLIATGSRPRTLPLLDGYDNVSVLRSLDDAGRLREVLLAAPRLAVVGAGFIGLEVAATARKLGAQVTIIEAAPSPLAGALGSELGGWFAGLHRDEGVDVITGCTVDAVDADGDGDGDGDGEVCSLRLSNGRRLDVDHVVVGIGVQPDVGWLRDSGLDVRSGVKVDPHGRTELPDVLAVGDAAATFDPIAGRHVPGSHWEAAGRQGARAAQVMLGLDPGVAPLTSFWTDQYGIRIQSLGHASLATELRIEGDPQARDFAAIFTRAGRAVAALLVDRPRSLPAVRKLIENGEPDAIPT